MRAFALLMLTCIACGDSVPQPQVFEAVSGARLKLQRLRYDDGTEQVDPARFYDAQLHTACQPGRWSDGALRCIPIAHDAAYTDNTCTTAVGLALTTDLVDPTHFLGRDLIDGARVPVRLYVAGGETAAIEAYWERRDGACIGPRRVGDDHRTFALAGEFDGSALVELHAGELGDGRIALRLLETDDGARVSFEVRDRQRELACRPTSRVDGVACEPSTFATTTAFQDAACERPVVIEWERPAVVRVDDAAGCSSYAAVAAEVQVPLYRRDAGGCVRNPLTPGTHAYALGAAIELPALGRTVETGAGRLRRVLFSDGSLHFVGDTLVDTATRAECRPQAVGDEIRCLPASTVDALTLYTSGCVVPVRAAMVREHVCGERPAFATAVVDGVPALYMIGSRVSTLYHSGDGPCVAFVVDPGHELRALGPALELATFERAQAYGAR